MPSAMARSKPVPSLRRSAGARFTVIRRSGNSNPLFRIAARTRSRASRTAVSGRPTMSKPGSPLATSTSTDTSSVSRPHSAQAVTRANPVTGGDFRRHAGANGTAAWYLGPSVALPHDARVLATIAVALVAIAVHLPNLPAGKAPQEDAGVFLYAAQVLLDGGLPYRDVWDHKPPLIYLIDALGLVLGGGSPLGVWALQAIAYAAAAAIGQRVMARAFGTPASLFGTVAWLLAAPRILLFDGYFTNFVQTFLGPLQFTALALYLAEERDRTRTWRTAAIGATAGLAALLTPAGLGLWLAIGTHLVATRIARGSLSSLLARLSLLALGASIPLAMAGAALGLAGIWGEAWDQAVRYNTIYSGSVTLAGRRDALAFGARLLGSGGFLFVAIAGAAIALRDRASLPRASDARRLVSVALIAMPFEILLGSASGREHGYYWLAALPALGILAAYGAFAFGRHLAPRLARRARRSAGALTAVAIVVALAALAVRPVPLMVRVATTTEDGVNAAATRYLAGSTTPNDTVFIWGSRAGVLFTADRRSPNRYIYQYAPLWTRGYESIRHVNELTAALTERPPTIVIDASRDSAATPSFESALAGGFDSGDPLFVVGGNVAKIPEVVFRLYVPAGRIEPTGWPVYRLRAP